MRILRQISEIEPSASPVVTIGTFDGVHLGHQYLIQQLEGKKKELNGTSYLITFEPHPQVVLDSRRVPIHILTTLEEKIEILKGFDIDVLLVLPFSAEFARLTGEDFIKNILVERIGVVEVVIGYDHAFGYKRSGNIETVKKLGERYGYRVTVVPPFVLDGTVVKSSLIRELLYQGDVAEAKRLLGRPYQIKGKVIKGSGRGRRLNFPTANLEPDDPNKLIPGNGIYAARVAVRGQWYHAAVSIGTRPTFQETKRVIEAFIIRFNDEIYGETITVQFMHKLRDELKFDSVEALTAQMQEDVENVKQYLEQLQN